MADEVARLHDERNRLIDERNQAQRQCAAARQLAREYYADIRQLVTDYSWNKDWAADVEAHPWLAGALDFLARPPQER